MKIIKSEFSKDKEYVQSIMQQLKARGLKVSTGSWSTELTIHLGLFKGNFSIEYTEEGKWEMKAESKEELDEEVRHIIKIFEDVVKREVRVII